MSRIGKSPVAILDGVDVDVDNDGCVRLKGTLGELVCKVDLCLDVKVSESNIILSLANESDFKNKSVRSKWGLYRALIANNMKGVSIGYSKDMELKGVGYKVALLENNSLEFFLGYSHRVLFEAPKSVSFVVQGPTKFTVSSIDKQLLGETCARIKRLRKRDPYKAKGIHFVGDIIKKKAGKTVKK